MVKGAMRYVPRELEEELRLVKDSFKIPKDSDALRTIANNSRIARQIKMNLDIFKRNK